MAGIEKILYFRSCLKSCNAYNISNPAIHKRVKATIGATMYNPSILHVEAIEPAKGPSARDAPKKKMAKRSKSFRIRIHGEKDYWDWG